MKRRAVFKEYLFNFRCNQGFLEIKSECDIIKYCGSKNNSAVGTSFIFTSCTNTVSVNYVSANPSSVNLRGFNIYYECNAIYVSNLFH